MQKLYLRQVLHVSFCVCDIANSTLPQLCESMTQLAKAHSVVIHLLATQVQLHSTDASRLSSLSLFLYLVIAVEFQKRTRQHGSCTATAITMMASASPNSGIFRVTSMSTYNSDTSIFVRNGDVISMITCNMTAAGSRGVRAMKWYPTMRRHLGGFPLPFCT